MRWQKVLLCRSALVPLLIQRNVNAATMIVSLYAFFGHPYPYLVH